MSIDSNYSTMPFSSENRFLMDNLSRATREQTLSLIQSNSPSPPRRSAIVSRSMLSRLVAIGCVSFAFALATPGYSDEPIKRFLERLKDEQMYDTAVKYLDSLSARNRVPSAMQADLPLERIILLQESLKTVRNPAQFEERNAQIEKGYKDFLANSSNHPRRSEARLKLADMLLERGQRALTESSREENKAAPDALRAKARTSFEEANTVFLSTQEELKPILESMAGDKVKPNETDRLELRARCQTEYRQAEILQGITMKFIAETFPEGSADWKQWLEKSEAKLNDLVNKTSGAKEAGRRFLSLLNRGFVQSMLGKIDEARDSFTRVADHDEPGIFRVWKVQAIAGMVRLDSTEKSPKYEAAILRGEEFLKTADARERDNAEWLDLQMALAEARIAWGKTIDEKQDQGKFRNNRREARELLQRLVKEKGEHQAKAKRLLSELGIEAKAPEDTKLPDVRNFADAIKAARERLDRAESSESALQILDQQLISIEADQRGPIQEQIDSVKADATRDREQSITLYKKALDLYRDSDSRDDLLQSRFLLSYLMLRTEKYWEAVAVSQFIMQTAKGSDTASKSAGFALLGLRNIIASGSPERQQELMPSLENLTKLIAAAAPGSQEFDEAVDLLVKLALISKKWEDAERYINMGGGKGGSSTTILGRILWAQYRTNVVEHRKNKTEETAEDADLKARAEKLLSKGWEALDPNKVDAAAIEGVNTLASLYLTENKLQDAEKVINDASKGSIVLLAKVPDLTAGIKLEAYRLNLQAMVQSAGKGLSQLSADQVTSAVNSMKQLDSGTLLSNSLRSLAAELQEQLENTKDLEQKAKLADAYGVLIQQLIAVNSDAATLNGAGSSLYTLATSMEKSPGMASKIKPLMEVCETAFEKLAKANPSELTDAGLKPDAVQLKLALAKRGSGKYKEAHEILLKSLTTTNSNITLQLEAARNLQQWADGKDKDMLLKAINGTALNDKKRNIVWGWGQISTLASKHANQREVFFEARYNIAVCRRLIGLASQQNARKEVLERAINDVRQTFVSYPEFASPEDKARSEALLKQIQQDLGQQPIGFAAFQSSANPGNGKPDPNNGK